MLFCFFFKQKTAYEMRISDWSSDVCSSDLTMNQPNRLVAALVYDDLCNFEFSCAAEIFGLPRPEFEPDWYRFLTVAAEPGPLRARFGFQIRPDAGLDRLNDADRKSTRLNSSH